MKFAKVLGGAAVGALLFATAAQAESVQEMADRANAELASSGANYRLAYMEYITTDDAEFAGRLVFFSNRGNRQLFAHFMPGDTRRAWSSGDPDTIDWSYDTVDVTADALAGGQRDAIYAAMATWDGQTCSAFGLNGHDAGDTGYVEYFLTSGGSGSPFIEADVMHSGFLPGAFFDALAPGGSTFILGVTFSYYFVDGSGNPTDLNNDGHADKAFGDIYYNDAFPWDTTGGHFDVETIALHEAGHGLSQAHFGEAFRTTSNGKLHFNPRAVMNAAYSGIQRQLTGTDQGGHCSLWSGWPN